MTRPSDFQVRDEQKSLLTELMVLLALITVLVILSNYSYLLFHTLVEMFSIVVAMAIFLLVWNTKEYFENRYFLILGVAYLFIGGLDLIHTLAYTGMGVFPGYDSNLPT